MFNLISLPLRKNQVENQYINMTHSLYTLTMKTFEVQNGHFTETASIVVISQKQVEKEMGVPFLNDMGYILG